MSKAAPETTRRKPPPRPDFTNTRLPPCKMDALPTPNGDLWVFGYGSLMWNPGFPVAQAIPARLHGYHRRLCLWSIYYRGTAAKPGLVLGLDRGGSCHGMALRVATRNTATASAYLLEREMMNDAYRPVIKKVYLQNGACADALVFVSKPEHPQFARPLSVTRTAAIILSAEGRHGKNCDYVLNTVRHLNEFDIRHTALHTLAEKLQRG